ncbi:hypothetical protein HNY73_015253 [Argiope bruennichi]|uniref:Uncharacterized protein n=1 Tax=Argiope bruennichi TaxID=94029 RepID=A0A8T0EWX2_ARGBR|nr:hypothetical protein HNY73_015253 [Argiope bruennichi]
MNWKKCVATKTLERAIERKFLFCCVATTLIDIGDQYDNMTLLDSRLVCQVRKFDEWTSKRNHRYLNINVHYLAEDFNLGLVPIVGTCDAQRTLELLSEKLQNFNLNLETDIVAATNDGAVVMKKIGKISPIINQLCFSHAIHLAVTDVLYKHREMAGINVSSEESEDEE